MRQSVLTEGQRRELGAQIRSARKRAGLSHDKLGAQVGTSRQHLIRLEQGQHAPSEKLLARIAEATGQPLELPANGSGPDDEDDEESDAGMRAIKTFLGDLVDRAVDARLARRDGASA